MATLRICKCEINNNKFDTDANAQVYYAHKTTNEVKKSTHDQWVKVKKHHSNARKQQKGDASNTSQKTNSFMFLSNNDEENLESPADASDCTNTKIEQQHKACEKRGMM